MAYCYDSNYEGKHDLYDNCSTTVEPQYTDHFGTRGCSVQYTEKFGILKVLLNDTLFTSL